MRKPQAYDALTEMHRLAAEKARTLEAANTLPLPAAPSQEGRFYGELQRPAEKPQAEAHMRMSDATAHPIVRSWSQRAGMMAQQRSANRWAQQSNASFARQAELRPAAPIPEPQIRIIATHTITRENPSMAVEPHYSDSIFGIIDELEVGMADTAAGVAQEAGAAAPAQGAEGGELGGAIDLDSPEMIELMAAADRAQDYDAAAAQVMEQEQEHEHGQG